ncbi:Holliday junction branch migration protein RuvA [Celeribacter halophilus]|uniref:Holliday junction branch migration complex subunit RuvA n=1 Tax=Celeribacter halophilus TaxID=576117 RepID=A0AAW7XSG5_9RHOB|nr:Holliday junction branch migration protein RuvA [Celeribacter halophilus]MDO6457206.1 Holliday junction branch migration protein RuvA [Celeribacter halophilus]MDO6723704.1 Holliday junction branch migration protein RuvA [Celeribacter halophilus]
MIGKITGVIDYIGTDHVLIDVRGVGYIVYVSERTRMALPGQGAPVALYTDLLVREDNLQLFGFTSLLEKEWYRLLISVQGIGSKAAMAILGTLGPEATGRAIALGDWGAVKAAPGVGPKIAQRVVNELKDKAPTVMSMGGSLSETLDAPEAADVVEVDTPAPAAKPARKAPAKANASAEAEALSALQNLGYSPSDAAGAVAQAAQDAPEAATSELIRAALKLLAPKG